MKLALVSDWFLPRLGGIELQMRDLAVRLRERGHEVEIITPVPGPDVHDGIRVHRLGAPRLPGAGIVFTPGAFAGIGRLLRAGNYDVVHVHFGIIAPAAYGTAFMAQSLGIPTVATFHSVLKHFEVPLWLLRGAMKVSEWRVKWSAVSTVVAESIRPLVGHQPVSILPNGIDPEWWSRPDEGCGGDDPHGAIAPRPIRAVSVLRLHRRKRPGALIRAVATVAKQLPAGRRLELRIIGDGGERRALERLIARERLDDVVTLCGWAPPETVRAELHRADVFLLASRLEAFGIAALEARCAGVPVIAMAESGARDFLAHGRDALLAGSDAEFTRHLHRVATDDDLRGRLAGAPIRQGADWQSVLARQEQLYAAASLDARGAPQEKNAIVRRMPSSSVTTGS